MPDEELARRLGRTAPALQVRRVFLGIPIFNPRRRNWTPKEESLLGKIPDEEVARRLRRTLSAIKYRRQCLGIADLATKSEKNLRRQKKLNARPWTKQESALLGKYPDAEVARRIHRSIIAVQMRRHLQGIACCSPKIRPWTSSEKALLGKLPDRTVAERLGRTFGAVRGRRILYGLHDPSTRMPWLKTNNKLLGTATDKEIGRQIGCCSETVAKRRRALGIPSFGESLVGLSQTLKGATTQK
jgi:hypothetical protein